MAKIPQPYRAHSLWAAQQGLDSTLTSLTNGRNLYVMKCDGCHSLYSVDRIMTRQWPMWIDSMRTEIRMAQGILTLEESNAIRNFLVVASGYLADSIAAAKKPTGGKNGE
jgi:hypothetical protein